MVWLGSNQNCTQRPFHRGDEVIYLDAGSTLYGKHGMVQDTAHGVCLIKFCNGFIGSCKNEYLAHTMSNRQGGPEYTSSPLTVGAGTCTVGSSEAISLRSGSTSAPIIETKITKKPMLQTVSNMMKKLLDADTQALVKAGYINGNLELTTEGNKALLAILFTENKAALVEAAEEHIAECKEECED